MRGSPEAMLEELYQTRRSEFVFSTETGSMRWHNWDLGFAKAVRGANIQKRDMITAHVLRHSHISQLLAYAKLDIKTVSYLAGHKDLNTTQGYIHLLSVKEEHHLGVERLPDYAVSDVPKAPDQTGPAKKNDKPPIG